MLAYTDYYVIANIEPKPEGKPESITYSIVKTDDTVKFLNYRP